MRPVQVTLSALSNQLLVFNHLARLLVEELDHIDVLQWQINFLHWVVPELNRVLFQALQVPWGQISHVFREICVPLLDEGALLLPEILDRDWCQVSIVRVRLEAAFQVF